jgi:hypothetical protein
MTDKAYHGRTGHRYWFVSPDDFSEHNYASVERHFEDAGAVVLYEPGARRVTLIGGDHEGWIAPWVYAGITPLSPLETLALEGA